MLEHAFEKLDRIHMFSFSLFGMKLDVGNTIVVSWIVMGALILLFWLFTRKLSFDKPGKGQLLVEWLVQTVQNLCKGSIGHHSRAFVPYLGTLLVYLAFSNIISIFNMFPFIELFPPTRDINVTGPLGLMSILIVFYATFRYKGVKGWLKSLIDPTPIMAPFKILEYVTKPLSLCLRLFGNIVAAFLIMEILLAFAPFVGAPFSLYFDLFDGILQAFIFVYLTSLYIGEAVE